MRRAKPAEVLEAAFGTLTNNCPTQYHVADSVGKEDTDDEERLFPTTFESESLRNEDGTHQDVYRANGKALDKRRPIPSTHAECKQKGSFNWSRDPNSLPRRESVKDSFSIVELALLSKNWTTFPWSYLEKRAQNANKIAIVTRDHLTARPRREFTVFADVAVERALAVDPMRTMALVSCYYSGSIGILSGRFHRSVTGPIEKCHTCVGETEN
jgi:hypothetical protein